MELLLLGQANDTSNSIHNNKHFLIATENIANCVTILIITNNIPGKVKFIYM